MSIGQWAQEIDADLDDRGLPTPSTIANHIRQSLVVAGYVLKSRLVRGLTEGYAPLQCDQEALQARIAEVMRHLLFAGDLAKFASNSGEAYVATPERLVETTNDIVLLGGSLNVGKLNGSGVRKLLRDEIPSDLDVPTVSLADEIGVPDWRLLLLTLGGHDNRDAGAPSLFNLMTSLSTSGETLADLKGGSVRVLSGAGQFFGNARGQSLEGRWSLPTYPGTFCAVRRTTTGWKNCVVTVLPTSATAWDVPETDIWRWAIIGQTILAGLPWYSFNAGVLQLFLPPTNQLKRILALAGEEAGAWRWTVDEHIVQLLRSLIEPSYH